MYTWDAAGMREGDGALRSAVVVPIEMDRPQGGSAAQATKTRARKCLHKFF